MDNRKRFWLKEELTVAEELLALAPQLTKEFLNWHKDFDTNFIMGRAYGNPEFNTDRVQSRKAAWKADSVQYRSKNHGVNIEPTEVIEKRYPTATALTRQYGVDCAISTYSILEKNSVITRHTGLENRDNLFVRIHIPLIVPPGDIFFECEGIEIDWTDLFAFDNQLVHSAHNLSPDRRLVYLIDISRERLGLEEGPAFDLERQLNWPEFVRGQWPKQLHSGQRAQGN